MNDNPVMLPERAGGATEFDKFWWGSSMACLVCDKCLCYTCHPIGPCIAPAEWLKIERINTVEIQAMPVYLL